MYITIDRQRSDHELAENKDTLTIYATFLLLGSDFIIRTCPYRPNTDFKLEGSRSVDMFFTKSLM